jgi:plasmid stabilization system protein ParE
VLDDVERAVCSLAEFPERGALPRDRRLRALNYRFLCVDSYLLFYRCDEKTNIVYVLAIVHTKQQYTNILK